MWLFLVPLLVGFALAGASAFTATYSKWWGVRGGQMATSILRNFVGIPLMLFGFILAWLQTGPFLFIPGRAIKALGWILIIAGSVPVTWGHVVLGWRTHMPSVQDTLVRDGLYTYVRHPIYTGMFLVLVGLAFLKPTLTFVVACLLGLGFFMVMARLEEIDLVQRLPAYRDYMKAVPRFVPRFYRKEGVNPKAI